MTRKRSSRRKFGVGRGGGEDEERLIGVGDDHLLALGSARAAIALLCERRAKSRWCAARRLQSFRLWSSSGLIVTSVANGGNIRRLCFFEQTPAQPTHVDRLTDFLFHLDPEETTLLFNDKPVQTPSIITQT